MDHYALASNAIALVSTVLVTYLITAPGTLAILRCRLASSITEAVSSGFFFGLGLIVLLYLGLSRLLAVGAIDHLLIGGCIAATVLAINEFRHQRLPFWSQPTNRVQICLVLSVLVFMLFSAFGSLCMMIDDDFFIHFPIIKRVALGDLPVHMPYFPDTLVRAHCARDVFVGTLVRVLNLRVELAIIYCTLAICPAYILVFHSLATRLAGRNIITSNFCFIGLLFLVSFAIGSVQVRAGCLTYIWNNNIIAYSYSAFFAWLIHRASSIINAESTERNPMAAIWKRKSLLFLGAIALASQYFIYISNFLMFSLFLGALPFLVPLVSNGGRRYKMVCALIAITGTVIAATIVHMLVSPFLIERVLISLNLAHPTEPMGWMQQAKLTFPKAHLFTITDCLGSDRPVFRRAFLVGQGCSFYLGLAGLIIGIYARRPALAATSMFGWLTMLWLMLVDMGEYRAEPLRLFLIAHIAFGAATGLIIGYSVEKVCAWLAKEQAPIKGRRIFQFSTVALSCSLCAWLARGTLDKFITYDGLNVDSSWSKLKKIIVRNPEDWYPGLNIPKSDFEILAELAKRIQDPNERLLVRMAQHTDCPDASGIFKNGPPHQLINAAYLTGAGIVGVCQEHGAKGMGARVFPYDYRASLFWKEPSTDILNQLSPTWILVDQAVASPAIVRKVLELPGVTVVCDHIDKINRHLLLLRYCRPHNWSPPNSGVQRLTVCTNHIQVAPHHLSTVPVSITPSSNSSKVTVGLEVIDDKGSIANTMDMPIMGVHRIGNNLYNLSFCMIQAGHWGIYFIDPKTGKRLNDHPMAVDVAQTQLAGNNQNI